MKRHCPTCKNLYRGSCVSDEVVGSNLDSDIEGEPQTREGVDILDWMADHLYAETMSTAAPGTGKVPGTLLVPGSSAVRRSAPPCPGWGRR